MLFLKERTLALALIDAKFKATADGAALTVSLSGLGDGEFTFESCRARQEFRMAPTA